MIGLVKRIEQEISDLEVAIADASKKMIDLRQQYVQVVAKASAHQIILATYQLCTREYPDTFLAISIDSKQRLQHEIQILANSFSQKMMESISPESLAAIELTLKDIETDTDTLEKTVTQTLVEASEAVHKLLADQGIFTLPLAENAAGVQLRLLDLELSDRQALSIRSELRVLGARLQHLKTEIVKKQKAKLVAEAELAWRATWTEFKPN
jgi:NurA-like 5'-3' nuclease